MYAFVYGAGSEVANGLYALNDRGTFVNVKNSAMTMSRVHLNGRYGWIIGCAPDAYYGVAEEDEEQSSGHLFPPLNGWRSNIEKDQYRGKSPAPMVRRASKGSSFVDCDYDCHDTCDSATTSKIPPPPPPPTSASPTSFSNPDMDGPSSDFSDDEADDDEVGLEDTYIGDAGCGKDGNAMGRKEIERMAAAIVEDARRECDDIMTAARARAAKLLRPYGIGVESSDDKRNRALEKRAMSADVEYVDDYCDLGKEPRHRHDSRRPPKTAVARACAPIKSGYVAKFSGKNWKRRFMTLRGIVLVYYVDHSHKDPRGFVLLEGAHVEYSRHVSAPTRQRGLDLSSVVWSKIDGSELRTPFEWTLTTRGGARWQFCALSQRGRDAWVDAIESTGVVAVTVTDEDQRVATKTIDNGEGSDLVIVSQAKGPKEI